MEESEGHKKPFLMDVYDRHYKKLMIITFVLLVLSFVQIGVQVARTGDFLSKDVSLKGGLTVSVSKDINTDEVKSFLSEKFSSADISVREISAAGQKIGVMIEAADADEKELISSLKDKFGLTDEQYSAEIIGSSLGESFFQETFKAIIIAFIFMGVVVFIYFSTEFWPRVYSALLGITIGLLIFKGSGAVAAAASALLILLLFYLFFKYSIPSVAVILCAFCDIVETLAIVNFLGIKIGTAGLAAFLMLIGYSVDTDILLTTRVLKRKGESVFQSTVSAAKTGLMLTATAMIAIIIALVLSQAEILRQIMAIVLIGLVLDVLNTWIQNAAILRWYLERKHGKD